MAPRRALLGFGTLLLGGLLAGCFSPGSAAVSSSGTVQSQAPVSTPVRSPSATPSVQATATLGPAKCESDNYTNYSAVGWRGIRVVVLAGHFIGCDMRQELLSADPAVGEWRSDAKIDTAVIDFQVASDGQSVALPRAGGLLVIDAAGNRHDVPRPAGTDERWGAYGLRVLPGGGYLVVGAEQLSLVPLDGGALTMQPLPNGYVVVAPTSDPDRFVLTPADDAQVPYGLLGSPFRAYLWDLKSGKLTLVASSVIAVEPAPHALAYLHMAAGGDQSLAADGALTTVKLPGMPAMRSPDASRYLYLPDLDSAQPQSIELRDAAAGSVLSQFRGVIGLPIWRGTTAAVVAGGGALPSELVILDGSSVRHLPLP